MLPDEEIPIAGQYGGEPKHSSPQGEWVRTKTSSEYITTVVFRTESGTEHVIFKNYGFYTCGFSHDGKYFAFAQDAGITILRRV